MSFFYRFKLRKDHYLSTITTLLDGARVTANEVTALGLCLALGAGLLAYYSHLYVGLILFATSAMCDAVDRSLARVSKIGTDFGMYFDGVAGRFSELFFISGVVRGAQVPPSAFPCGWFRSVSRRDLWPRTSVGLRVYYFWEA